MKVITIMIYPKEETTISKEDCIKEFVMDVNAGVVDLNSDIVDASGFSGLIERYQIKELILSS